MELVSKKMVIDDDDNKTETTVLDTSTNLSVEISDEGRQVPQLSENVIMVSSDKIAGESDGKNEMEETTQAYKIVEPVFSEAVGTESEKIKLTDEIIAEGIESHMHIEEEYTGVAENEQGKAMGEILIASKIVKEDTYEINLDEASKCDGSVNKEPLESTVSGQVEAPTDYKATPGRKRKAKAKSDGNTRPPSTRGLRSVIIPNGVGVNLGEIPGIDWNSLTPTMIELLHKMIYGRIAQSDAMAENIKLFHGYEFQFNSFEYNRKLASLNDLSLSDIRLVATFFNLGSTGRKDEVISRIALFLLNPAEMAEQQQQASKNSSKRGITRSRSSLQTVKPVTEASGSHQSISIKRKKTEQKPPRISITPTKQAPQASSSYDDCVPSTSGVYIINNECKIRRAVRQKHVQYKELSSTSSSNNSSNSSTSSSDDENRYQHKSRGAADRKSPPKLDVEPTTLLSTSRASAHSSISAASRYFTESAPCTSTHLASDESDLTDLRKSEQHPMGGRLSPIKEEGEESKIVDGVHVQPKFPPSVETTDSADKIIESELTMEVADTVLKQADAAMESNEIKVTDNALNQSDVAMEVTDTVLKQADTAIESDKIKVTNKALNQSDVAMEVTDTVLKQADAAIESDKIKVTNKALNQSDVAMEVTDTVLKQADAVVESDKVKVTNKALNQSDVAMEVTDTVLKQADAAIESDKIKAINKTLNQSGVAMEVTDTVLKQADAVMESDEIKVTDNGLNQSDVAMEVTVTVNQSGAAINVIDAVLNPSNMAMEVTEFGASEDIVKPPQQM